MYSVVEANAALAKAFATMCMVYSWACDIETRAVPRCFNLCLHSEQSSSQCYQQLLASCL